MTDTYSTLKVSVTDGVAYAVIDNPPLNLLDAALMVDLDRFADAMSHDDDVRVVVFDSADPDFFVAHGDMRFVDDFESFGALPVAPQQDPSLNPMMRLHERVRSLPQITIAKLRGLARGGGAELLSAMDMRIASLERAGLAQPEAGLGIIRARAAPPTCPVSSAAHALGDHPRRAVDRCRHRGTARLGEPRGAGRRTRPRRRHPRRPCRRSAARRRSRRGRSGRRRGGLDRSRAGAGERTLGRLFAEPAASRLGKAALAAGAQTRDGERHLEALVDGLG
ncbi:enoyl-CoA hydratase/isomerase family protein [Streptomyces sp. M19]